MSSITSTSDLKTLTGGTGGTVVSPSGAGNITITAGTGIVVTGDNGAHTITIANSGAEASFFQADLGNAVPLAGVVNLLGPIGGNITTTASGDTIDFSVTGTNNHSVLVGTSIGALRSLTVGNDGEVLIGRTGSDPKFNLLTSSTGSISFVTGPGTLDMNVVGGGMQWQTVLVNTNMAVNNGYITEGFTQIEFDLPAVCAVGDEVKIVDAGNSGLDSPWRINVSGLQAIFAVGDEVTSLNGYVEPAGGTTLSNFSTITLRCVTANKFWVVESAAANLNFV